MVHQPFDFNAFRDRINAKLGELDAYAAGIDAHAQAVLTEFRNADLRADRGESTDDVEPLAVAVNRAQRLVKAGRPHEVGTRDARRICNAILHDTVDVALVRALVRTYPSSWSGVARCYFAQWDTLREVGKLKAWASLLEEAPKDLLQFVRVNISHRPTLLTEDAPLAWAKRFRQLDGGTLEELATDLARRGFPVGWSFSMTTLAFWLGEEQGSLSSSWQALAQAGSALGPVLLVNENEKLGPLVSPIRARVAVLASFMRAGLVPAKLVGTEISAFEGRLFDALGDPRWTKRSDTWRTVAQTYPKLYGRFLERLCREDLEFFFNNLTSTDPTRLAFWLQYLPSIKKTSCILAADDWRRLQAEAQAGLATEQGAKLARIVRRAQTFSRSTRVAAICLDFGAMVAVEFSITPNAAYLYDATAFSAEIEPRIRERNVRDENDLKRRDLDPERVIHNSAWTSKLESTLATRYQISPSSRSSWGELIKADTDSPA